VEDAEKIENMAWRVFVPFSLRLCGKGFQFFDRQVKRDGKNQGGAVIAA
jgi:hypothetical protein